MRKIGIFLALLIAAASVVPAAAETKTYTLVYLKTGPQSGQLPEAEAKTAFEGHFANMNRLAEERKLLVAGPFGDQRHDVDLRGLFVLDTAKDEEARAWAGTDPTVKAGVFLLDYHRLTTDAGFAAALDRHFAREAKAKQEGRQLELQETMRGYVWLIAADREKARRELAPLLAEKKVFLVGDLDASQLLVLLDAEKIAQAKERYGAVLARVGEHQLDEWYGSNELAKL